MSIFSWIFLGLIAGYIASRALNERGDAVFFDVMLVISGAIYGGFLFTWMSAAGVTGFHLNKMFVEVVVICALLVVCGAMFVRRPSAPDLGDVRSRLTTSGRASSPGVRAGVRAKS